MTDRYKRAWIFTRIISFLPFISYLADSITLYPPPHFIPIHSPIFSNLISWQVSPLSTVKVCYKFYTCFNWFCYNWYCFDLVLMRTSQNVEILKYIYWKVISIRLFLIWFGSTFHQLYLELYSWCCASFHVINSHCNKTRSARFRGFLLMCKVYYPLRSWGNGKCLPSLKTRNIQKTNKLYHNVQKW